MPDENKIKEDEEKDNGDAGTLKHATPRMKRKLGLSLLAAFVFFGIFITVSCVSLYQDKMAENDYWNKYASETTAEQKAEVASRSENATKVKVAICLEQIRSIDIKNSTFDVVILAGFRWENDSSLDFSKDSTINFYRGQVKDTQVKDSSVTDGTYYQMVRYEISINKQFWTPRFPLESHQLRIYMEPAKTVRDIVLEPDKDSSYISENIGVTGYNTTRFDVEQVIQHFDTGLLNPDYDSFDRGSDTYITEVMTAVEVNRDGFGLYFKCFIALYGTMAWILLCLYICTYRRVDPLGMVGAAFFGAVSNIMVGANLVSESLSLGLLEYMNVFGICVILAGVMIVIAINASRKERGHEKFAKLYGRAMLIAMTLIVLIANIAMPLSAYMF